MGHDLMRQHEKLFEHWSLYKNRRAEVVPRPRTGGRWRNFREFLQEIIMSEQQKAKKRTFTQDFKQASVDLVVKQGYSLQASAKAVGVSQPSMRQW